MWYVRICNTLKRAVLQRFYCWGEWGKMEEWGKASCLVKKSHILVAMVYIGACDTDTHRTSHTLESARLNIVKMRDACLFCYGPL